MSAQKTLYELMFSLHIKDAGLMLSLSEEICSNLLADLIVSEEFNNTLAVMRGEEME